MPTDLPLLPEQASTLAPRVDALFLYLFAVNGFFAALIFTLVFYFAIRYRKSAKVDRRRNEEHDFKLELAWTLAPLIIAMSMFFWGAKLYVDSSDTPPGAQEVYVVGKQWMWKFYHPSGQREINDLHVPIDRPIRLITSSQDVVHSFFIPAFRVKQDVLPGRFTELWFQANKPGKYHLFCSQYCGTNHSGMVGWVYALEPNDYEKWLSGAVAALPLAEQGAQIFEKMGCATCHNGAPDGRGPNLAGLYQKKVKLGNGDTVVADEAYLRESLLDPAAKVVEGYKPIMPTYFGQIGEEGIMALVAYIKSLGPAKQGG
jgi:cytochrome c oxidase subunit 2